MIHQSITNKFTIFLSTLSLWLVAASLAFIIADRNTSLVALSFLVLIVVFSVTRLFSLSGWMMALFALVVYVAVNYYIQAFTVNLLIQGGIALLAFGVTVILTNQVMRYFEKISAQVYQDQKILGDLVQFDPKTNLMRWSHARQKLFIEVSRSRRYKNKLSILVLEPVNLQVEEWGDANIPLLNVQLSSVLHNSIRQNLDIAFIGNHIGIILPETDEKGALELAQRIASAVARKVRVDICLGVSSFPEDAVDEENLVKTAETALDVAISSGQTVVSFSKVRTQVSE
jgi:GGDEF domain-containing protein